MKIKLTALLVGSALFLVSCGDSLTLAEGGMSGTGITTGRITGFGSIYVNGIHYDVDNALFYRNGAPVTDQTSFAAGEFITVTGSLNSDGISGIASQVKFDGLVKATVEAIAADGKSIKVLGQTVQIDLLTVLHGFDQISDLQLGNLVEVSGDRLPNAAIKATSISLIAGSYQTTDGLQVVGAISALNPPQKTFQLNGLTVNYGAANLVGWNDKPLANGQIVQVKASALPVSNVLAAKQLSLQTTQGQYPDKSRLELEGIVSAITAATQFTLAGQTVITTASTQFIGLSASNLALGLTLEVEGNVDSSGNLQAERVILRDVSSSNGKELAGQITAIDKTLNTISLAGYILYLDNGSMLLKNSQTAKRLAQRSGHHEVTKFEDLVVGDYIEATVIQFADGTWHVLRLDRGGRPDQLPQ
ncbi:DUF5666 domain-containing protein [uncultured Thiothrix sp.]|uniref:DUF5666 domain-containing protein n=1 Tax=uncultured Thiothrix sp. TaxID=223185 RepID=UPI002635F22C|nr:DUF5666 domain-containing protein [uncultured Thiothrix sp.]